MRSCMLILMLALGACSSAQVDGTATGGVATFWGPTPAPAVAAADAHCKRYGRTSSVTQVDGWGFVTFACQP